MTTTLKHSDVIFNEEHHVYFTQDFEPLQGITGLLRKHLFPNKYDGIDEETLKRAAERGTAVHKACEAYDDGDRDNMTDEVFNYARICFENELHHEASEYLISDGKHFASAIDKVFRINDNEFELADIKTTSVLDLDYVRWQLSIYAYLFEMQNPDARVTRLTAIWLRGEQSKYEQVERVPDMYVQELLQCEIDGREFSYKELAKASSALVLPPDIVDRFKALKEQAEKAVAEFDKVKDMLFAQMQQHNVKSWDCDVFKATVVPESTSITFDAKKFEAENPELFNKYKTKETKRKSSLKLTFR